MARVGHLNRIWKDPFRVAGTVQDYTKYTHYIDYI